MKLFNLIITSAILASGLSATELKRSMEVVPMDPKYLSTENGGANHASAALSDGIGIYTTQEDEYSKAIVHLNGKYGDDALKNEKSLKQYVLDNGTAADKELANKLNLATAQKSNPGAPCDDKNPQTENDIYLDENFTCQGKPISKSIKCVGKPIGSQFEFEGKTYLVVDNNTIRDNLSRAETLCTSNVTNMNAMFFNAASFNQPIGDWDTSNVTNMRNMFNLAASFNQPIGGWDTSNIIDMQAMFYYATSFNQPLNWDTGNVTDMNSMFGNATSFNQPLNWDTGNVTTMPNMFSNATSFNQLLNWDTSKVTYMSGMFQGATLFNKPLNWNTSNVTDMGYMFWKAKSFNQPLNWNTSNVINYNNFAINSALTSANAPSKNGTKFPTTY